MPLTTEAASSEVTALLGMMAKPAEGKLRYLITAGPTYEDLDQVRFLGNRSTGRMGITLAEAAAAQGHAVFLILGPTQLAPPKNISTVRVRCAREMLAAVQTAFDWCDVLCMAAAVADYRPADYVDGKIHKGNDEINLPLVRNPDILHTLSETRSDQIIVGFSLDTHIVLEEAEAKRKAKGMDIIVANTQHAFGGVSTDAVILQNGADPMPAGNSKEQLSKEIVNRSSELAIKMARNSSHSMRMAARRKPPEKK